MLDDDAAGFAELLDAFERGVGVGDVVEGKRLALQRASVGDTGFGLLGRAVKRRRLVRVFAVAHR